MPTISSLFIYPIKSCQGLALRDMQFDARGPVGDRRWLVVDQHGRFLTQRENPKLALITPFFQGQALFAHAPGLADLAIPSAATTRRDVRVWSFEGPAEDLGDDCAHWFSEVLQQPCRLVRFAEDVHRPVSKQHTALDAEVAFSDGYPALAISLESLCELNRRLETPLPMGRFRPNLVLRDCQPFEEDEWHSVAFPELTLDFVKPCTRCSITTLNAEILKYGKEPLTTLAKFRRGASGVFFGQNVVHHGPGRVKLGDSGIVLSRNQTSPSLKSLNPSN